MDRLFKGFLSGILGAIPMNLLNLTFYKFKLTNIRFIDWASIIMLGKLPNDLHSIIYTLFIQILWSGALGIGMVLIYPYINGKGYYIKGTLYAFLLGFIFRGIVVLFRIPELSITSTLGSELNFMAVISWGLTAAFILRRLVKTDLEGSFN